MLTITIPIRLLQDEHIAMFYLFGEHEYCLAIEV